MCGKKENWCALVRHIGLCKSKELEFLRLLDSVHLSVILMEIATTSWLTTWYIKKLHELSKLGQGRHFASL